MYIKLTYTADKYLKNVTRAVEACIADNSITDVTSAQIAAASWDSTLTDSIDWDNCEIIRTVDPDLVETAITTNTSSNTYYRRTSFNIRFPVFDDLTTKYTISLAQFSEDNADWRIGNESSMNAFSGTAYPPGDPDTGRMSAYADNYIGINGTENTDWFRGTANAAYTSIPNRTIRTVFCYITNECMIWATTHATTTPTGYGTTYSNASAFSGPWIFSQYSRYDIWNLPLNNIIPVAFSNFRTTGQGFRHLDFDRYNGYTEALFASYAAFRVFNIYDTKPKIGTEFPEVRFAHTHWGSGSLFNDISSLRTDALGNSRQTAGGMTYWNQSSIPALIRTDQYFRYPSSDLKTIGFAMYPMQIRNNYAGFGGGNMTERGGFYLFNGDYQPGDEFDYNSKTYTIMPTFDGYNIRAGIAVPKE